MNSTIQALAGPFWIDAGLAVIYLATAAWAFLAYRKTDGQAERLLYLSIIAVVVLVIVSNIVGWLQPQFAELLHHPVGTVLGYLFAALVVVALVLDALSRSRRTVR